ncbi:MAG: apolipoprotein N-acyltransferase [bacterium]
MERIVRHWRILAALLSGVLLALSFPPFKTANLAWVALIPLLIALIRQPEGGNTVGQAFRLGISGGLVFWLLSLSWLFRLFETSPAPMLLIGLAWLFLGACCALYWGAFSVAASWLCRKVGTAKLWQSAILTILLPVVWVGWEVARSYWFTGFPWNLLGVSQYRNIVLIQWVQWAGVPGISALVMLANTSLAFTLIRYLPPCDRKYRPHIELFIALTVIALCYRSGYALVLKHGTIGNSVDIVAIQPAIPQVQKWSQDQIDIVHSSLRNLTIGALDAEVTLPDLVIWPETATPYCVTEEGESRDLALELCRKGAPLLIGSMDILKVNRESLCYNGSFLFATNGVITKSYYKQHLVPFGEYVPLSGWIPWLANLAPMGWNCQPGKQATVFTMGKPSWSFSCLICFEDIMAGLSRAFVKAGARLLINQTNDAWFDRSAGPEQHLSHCVFRCVENRVSAIRVANSGITCLILPTGVILNPTENARGTPPQASSPRWQVPLPDADFQPTVYTCYGDWIFGIPCGVIAVAIFLAALIPKFASKK